MDKLKKFLSKDEKKDEKKKDEKKEEKYKPLKRDEVKITPKTVTPIIFEPINELELAKINVPFAEGNVLATKNTVFIRPDLYQKLMLPITNLKSFSRID